ncbi:MAG: MBL fold metallo-hydrolase, partial [Myxococcales bacterium]|nr:MBL fold metallo-hydrolase [Myxococcales bacterium]
MTETHRLGDFEVHRIPTGRWKENCYVVHHSPSGDQLAIDPGADLEAIVPVVEAGGGTLRHILLTHGHYDHVGAVADLSERYGVPCHLHRKDKRLLLHAPMYGMRWDKKKVRPIKQFVTYEEDASFELGGVLLEVVPCPGHTLGGVTYGFGAFAFT